LHLDVKLFVVFVVHAKRDARLEQEHLAPTILEEGTACKVLLVAFSGGSRTEAQTERRKR